MCPFAHLNDNKCILGTSCGFFPYEKIIYGEVIYGEVRAEGFKQVINVENERNVCPKVSTLGGQSSSCTQAAWK